MDFDFRPTSSLLFMIRVRAMCTPPPMTSVPTWEDMDGLSVYRMLLSYLLTNSLQRGAHNLCKCTHIQSIHSHYVYQAHCQPGSHNSHAFLECVCSFDENNTAFGRAVLLPPMRASACLVAAGDFSFSPHPAISALGCSSWTWCGLLPFDKKATAVLGFGIEIKSYLFIYIKMSDEVGGCGMSCDVWG